MAMTAREYKEAARTPYAWPGGYPTALLMADGESLCMRCARENAREILARIHNGLPPNCDAEWLPEAHYVNYEDSELYCAGCNDRIESAYEEAVRDGDAPPLRDPAWVEADRRAAMEYNAHL